MLEFALKEAVLHSNLEFETPCANDMLNAVQESFKIKDSFEAAIVGLHELSFIA